MTCIDRGVKGAGSMVRSNRSFALLCALLIAGCVVSQGMASDYAVPDKAKALDAAKALVAEVAKSGKKVKIWVNIGTDVKADLTASDDKTLTVTVDGNPFPIKWEKIPQEQVARIIKNLCQEDVAKNALTGMDFTLATGQLDKAEEFMTLAAAESKDLSADLKARIKALSGLKDAAKAAANPAPAAVAAASAKDKDEPQAYKAPEKIAYRPSEFGYLVPVKDVAAAIDNNIEIALAEQGIKTEAICDDPAFLRRVMLDITGEIPSPEEVIKFYGEGGSAKRARVIDELLKRPEYADHWATFWSVLLVGRKTKEEPDVKPHFFRSWLREQFARNEKFDKVVADILTATGENDKEGPVNYLTFHMNDTLPISVGHISQTFLGARIACAQCHDHPFDKWTQQDFWGFASFLADTRSDRKELREDPADATKVTRAWHVVVDSDQRNGGDKYEPPQPELRLPAKVLDGPVFATGVAPSKSNDGNRGKGKKAKDTPSSDKSMGDKSMADKSMDKPSDKSMDKSGDKSMSMGGGMSMEAMMSMDDAAMMSAAAGKSGTQGTLMRKAFAAWVTSPKNEKFNQSAVNRIWRNMFGYGLVEPVDDIRPKNPAVYPEVMKILSEDFNASGRDLQRLIAIIANTRAYQRASIGTMLKVDRTKQVRNFARAEVRPMTPEELLMAVVKATGGADKATTMEEAIRKQDADSGYGGMAMGGAKGGGGAGAGKGKGGKGMMMDMGYGGDLGEYNMLMQRFVGTSTAEDRAGKLQFEGTVAQALMMMHSPFMTNYVKQGVKRFNGDMTWLFATTLGRPPTPEEASAFSRMSSDPEGMLWVLLNSSEFVTIH